MVGLIVIVLVFFWVKTIHLYLYNCILLYFVLFVSIQISLYLIYFLIDYVTYLRHVSVQKLYNEV
jgi:hypothetical protein